MCYDLRFCINNIKELYNMMLALDHYYFYTMQKEKKMCLIPVTRPYLFFLPTLNFFPFE